MWFPVSATSLRADKILEALFEVSPDSSQTNRLPTPQAPFLSQASYSDETVTYLVQVLPGRVNLVLQPANGEASTEDFGHPPLIDFEANFDRAISCILKLPTGLIGDCLRLSIIPNFAWRRQSQAEANEVFSSLTSTTIRVDSRDLLYQFNDRGRITQGIEINQIHSFGVAEYQMFQFQLGQGQNIGVMPGNSMINYVATLSLDFNTVPDGRILSESLQKLIFEDLRTSVSQTIDTLQIGELK